MKVTTATFISSYAEVSKCPLPDKPEFAFIGRSNVGKSSLINMLTNSRKLAKVSVTPGKTQTINHYLINSAWYLVDLPGYGYAKVNKNTRAGFGKMIENYVLKRKNLTCLFVLVDARLPPQAIDLDFIEWAGNKNIPLAIVLTKIDKLKRNELQKNLKKLEQTLLARWEELPTMILTSSEKKQGKEEILVLIEELITEQKGENL
jgi:GTP-binding protein